MKTDAVNRNARFFYLVQMAINALKIIGAAEQDQDILLCLDRIRDHMDNTFKHTETSQFESTNNLLWNALILLGMYSLKMSPTRILSHDWISEIPFISHISSLEEDTLYPFVLAISVLRHYINNVRAYPTATIIAPV